MTKTRWRDRESPPWKEFETALARAEKAKNLVGDSLFLRADAR
jgi:hypothetical protein